MFSERKEGTAKKASKGPTIAFATILEYLGTHAGYEDIQEIKLRELDSLYITRTIYYLLNDHMNFMKIAKIDKEKKQGFLRILRKIKDCEKVGNISVEVMLKRKVVVKVLRILDFSQVVERDLMMPEKKKVKAIYGHIILKICQPAEAVDNVFKQFTEDFDIFKKSEVNEKEAVQEVKDDNLKYEAELENLKMLSKNNEQRLKNLEIEELEFQRNMEEIMFQKENVKKEIEDGKKKVRRLEDDRGKLGEDIEKDKLKIVDHPAKIK
jgi:hypothetical protein